MNDSPEKLATRYANHREAMRGTEMHDLAHNLIRLGVKLPRTQATLNLYVNDCIGWKMKTEVILFYSFNAFGSADAIGFNERKHVLRVSDLKNGKTRTSEVQLEVYAALFCLEYGRKPHEMDIELRIYQNDEVRFYLADPDRIVHIMDRIITFDNYINSLEEAL